MRKREPDGADLLPSGHEAVEHPARDDNMRARVVVAQRQADRGVVPRGNDAGEEYARGDERRMMSGQTVRMMLRFHGPRIGRNSGQ